MAHPSKSKSSPRIRFEVTQDVIERSCRRDSSHCMIADALIAAIPNALYVSVDLATIRFTDLDAGKRYIYLTPRPAQAALLAFDYGEQVEPFTVQLSGAHVLPTGNARRGKTRLEPQDDNGRNGTPPERRGGQSPPVGPLQGGAPRSRRPDAPGDGAGAGAGAAASRRTGRRRQFGLRAIIR